MNCMRLFIGFVMFEHAGALLLISSDGSSPRKVKCQVSIHKAREKLKSFKVNENRKALLPS